MAIRNHDLVGPIALLQRWGRTLRMLTLEPSSTQGPWTDAEDQREDELSA